MNGKNGKVLKPKIKTNIFINEEEAIENIAIDIESMIVKYLVEKCGAGNFVVESDVQF